MSWKDDMQMTSLKSAEWPKLAAQDPTRKPGYVAAKDMKHPGYDKPESTKMSLAQISSFAEAKIPPMSVRMA